MGPRGGAHAPWSALIHNSSMVSQGELGVWRTVIATVTFLRLYIYIVGLQYNARARARYLLIYIRSSCVRLFDIIAPLLAK